MTHSPRHAAPKDTVSDHEALIMRANARVNYGAQPFPAYSKDEQLIILLAREARALHARLERAAEAERQENETRKADWLRKYVLAEPQRLSPRQEVEQRLHEAEGRIRTQADESISAEAGQKRLVGTEIAPTERRDMTFPPDAKLIVTTGHLPTKESGLWRRVRRTDQQ